MQILQTRKINKNILIVNVAIVITYFTWWLNPSHAGNPILYALLLFGELYHVLMALTFWHTVWPRRKQKILSKRDPSYQPTIDIYIPVTNEPIEIIRSTVRAVKHIAYSAKEIYILNDGFVTHNENWQYMEILAQEEGVHCLTRREPGGAKAGNINNALRQTTGEIIVIFDADMMPLPNFLQKIIPYFQKTNVAFVQTPQYYKNNALNAVTTGAWEQQAFFFGTIMEGKGKVNAAFICGTNVALRRQALLEVGGMAEDNIAEDFLTSLFIHQKKWQSYYHPEILCNGLAPEDLLSYYNQQFRWARGSLEILFKYNPFFSRQLTIHQKIEYMSSALYYFNGIILLIDIIMPLIFLFFGLQPVASATTFFAIFFIPFLTVTLYTLYLASNGTFTFRAMAFSQSIWTLQLLAVLSVLFNRKKSFHITSKKALRGNFLYLTYPHIMYGILAIIGIVLSLYREGINPSVMTNIAWVLFNVCMFFPFIQASTTWKLIENPQLVDIKNVSG